MRVFTRFAVFGLLLGMLVATSGAATLAKLTLDEMTAKSTAIVRARVGSSHAAAQGQMIYTHYQLQVSERWKGPAAASADVVVPGGAAGGFRQTFSGTPKLTEGAEYVFFLWTSRSGLTHILGLSQGVMNLTTAGGELVANRPAATEMMMDSAGRTVRDEPFSMRLNDLRSRVSAALAQGGRQ